MHSKWERYKLKLYFLLFIWVAQGKVYKGVLSNNQSVAVKHITSECYMETFVREVRSLYHVRHHNLVALLGYCESEGECFLVYELCHNGNLSEWLFGIFLPLSFIHSKFPKFLSLYKFLNTKL